MIYVDFLLKFHMEICKDLLSKLCNHQSRNVKVKYFVKMMSLPGNPYLFATHNEYLNY